MRGDSTTAVLDRQYPVEGDEGEVLGTICTSTCELLITDGNRCLACNSHRDSLRKMLSRSTEAKSKSTAATSHVNLCYLSTPEKREKHTNLKTEIVTIQRETSVLQRKVDDLLHDSRVELEETDADDLLQVATDSQDAMDEVMPAGSPMRLLWEQQRQALRRNAKGMRWHPLIVKWCLSLKLKSPAAYCTLKEIGFLVLPSERTLRDYTHIADAQPGYHEDVESQLVTAACLHSSPPYQRLVILAIDEMKIKQDLVFNKHTGALTGFVNLRDADKALRLMEQSEVDDSPILASHVMVVMIRFLFKKLNFVYAVFPTDGAAGAEIYSVLWEGISRLEMFLGLKVRN